MLRARAPPVGVMHGQLVDVGARRRTPSLRPGHDDRAHARVVLQLEHGAPGSSMVRVLRAFSEEPPGQLIVMIATAPSLVEQVS